MKFLMDVQIPRLKLLMDRYPSFISGQLITPLTSFKTWQGQFAVDNGAFTQFSERRYRRILDRNEVKTDRCKFVTVPDIVGSGRRTLEIFRHRDRWISSDLKIALVIQNGMEDLDIPWSELQAIFIGGIDPYKSSKSVADIVKTALILKKHVHVGRVNTATRFDYFSELGADTCDGSGVARYDHMMQSLVSKLTSRHLPFN